MNIPEDLRYSHEHEWVRVEGDTATVGITDYAQNELGDIVFVEFPDVGDDVETGGPAGTIEAVKTVADLFAPVSGRIVAVNEDLADNPDRVNKDPYGEGWMIRISLSKPVELEDLLNAEDYGKLLEE
ncbi:MAG: glycine cleavage system protein GcvH [Candidatus Eisenbacteria bacterium]|nr:glycine cleavage system protein GcvH [Candidatus Eisenbacteria bacterium]